MVDDIEVPRLRIVFCGTPEFAVPTLRKLLSTPRFSVEAVVTQPDRPQGRSHRILASPVKQLAIESGVQVYQPEKIRSDPTRDFFEQIAPDAVVIVAYGQIVPAPLLAVPRMGWINLHASLLPKYRGAAPIAWAIANGETLTGVTTMRIDAGMDTGPLLQRQQIGILADEFAPDLARRMSEAGASLMIETLTLLDRGEIAPIPQDNSEATYAPLLRKEDGRVDWSRSAQEIYNRIRGFAPWPGAYTRFRGHLCRVWGHPAPSNQAAAAVMANSPTHPIAHSTNGAALPGLLVSFSDSLYAVCGHDSLLALTELQLEGRRRITSREFMIGLRPAPGERFESQF